MVEADLTATLDAIELLDPVTFDEQVRADADRLAEMVTGGTFDNPQALTGLEYEFYAVSDPDPTADDTAPGSLARVPRRLLEFIRFEKELGLHNAELATNPLPLNADGLVAQEKTVSAQVRSALTCTGSEGLRLVSDGMWTIPPRGETARSYLTDSVEVRGQRIATNMSASPRYHAMAKAPAGVDPAMTVRAPNVTLSAETVMPESLITSIQPHYQVPRAANLPRYFSGAVRVAAPLVALGANSPFFPPDLYDEVDPETILAEAHHDHRIRVFESVMNDPSAETDKVGFPRDFGRLEEVIDRIAADPVLVPLAPERGGRFDDAFATFRLKSGTYWRWIRPVFDGATRSDANARIEFRPLSAQPTIRDSIGFQAAFAGLMEALPAQEHPVMELAWEDARENFYRATRDGIDAELSWLTAEGTEPETPRDVYEDVLDQAAAGLRMRGCSEEIIARYLGPLRRRVHHGVTPADWKIRQVRSHLDAGESFADAVRQMQLTYLRNQESTLFDGRFTDWIEDKREPVR